VAVAVASVLASVLVVQVLFMFVTQLDRKKELWHILQS
jgi:hypothetical protein